MKRGCRTFLMNLLGITTYAQKDSLAVQIDSTSLKAHTFSEDLRSIYNSEEFNYQVDESVGVNLLERFINWLFHILQDLFGIEVPPGIQSLLTNLIYILLLISAIYFIVKLLVGKESLSFFQKKHSQISSLQIDEEEWDQIDLDELLTKALDSKNYRLAIRYLYLKTLKELTLQNLIQFHAEKTNSDYLYEIKDRKAKLLFQKISYAYEYIWYGEFEIDKDGFNQAKSSYDQLIYNKS